MKGGRGRRRGGSRRGVDASGMICMSEKDLGGCLHAGERQIEKQHPLYIVWVVPFFLPARFDWSIMGCTILLLALMNLAERGGKKQRGEKQMLNHPAFTDADSSRATTKTKQFCNDLMATLATESLREALTTKRQQTKGQLCADLGTQWGILLMFLMIYSPLF